MSLKTTVEGLCLLKRHECVGFVFGVVSLARDGAAGEASVRSFLRSSPSSNWSLLLPKAETVRTSVNKLIWEEKPIWQGPLIWEVSFGLEGWRTGGETTMWSRRSVRRGWERHCGAAFGPW